MRTFAHNIYRKTLTVQHIFGGHLIDGRIRHHRAVQEAAHRGRWFVIVVHTRSNPFGGSNDER